VFLILDLIIQISLFLYFKVAFFFRIGSNLNQMNPP